MVRRRALKFLGRLLKLEDTPERVAFAFAIGVALAFSPLLGLHTLLGLMLAFVFGLNRVAILVGLFVNNPWTLLPIYGAAAYVGGWFIGFPSGTPLPSFGWQEMWRSSFWVQLAQHWRILKPVFLGSAILSVAAASLSYPLALYFLHKARSRRAQ